MGFIWSQWGGSRAVAMGHGREYRNESHLSTDSAASHTNSVSNLSHDTYPTFCTSDSMYDTRVKDIHQH